jgi:hypothetical protein
VIIMALQDVDPFTRYQATRDGVVNHDPNITKEDLKNATSDAIEAATLMGDPIHVILELKRTLEKLESETQ